MKNGIKSWFLIGNLFLSPAVYERCHPFGYVFYASILRSRNARILHLVILTEQFAK